jgi:ParB/RepB/Spo0J family partition protein
MPAIAEATRQLKFPYKIINEVANRSFVRENFKASTQLYKIPVKKIKVRTGFNVRTIFGGIEDLAASIKECGQQVPLEVDVLPNGVVYLVKGHRRLKALQLLIDSSVEGFDEVLCKVNSTETTEFKRIVELYADNMYGEKLSPLEEAAVAMRLKTYYAKELPNNEAIGKAMGGISRQKVDNLLKLAGATEEVKEKIAKGEMKATDVYHRITTVDKPRKNDRNEQELAKTSSKNGAPKDALAKDMKELNELNESSEAKEEKTPTYDKDRDEIKWCQNVIGLLDKISVKIDKSGLTEQYKKDVEGLIRFAHKDMVELRDWVHKNKKQNKAR